MIRSKRDALAAFSGLTGMTRMLGMLPTVPALLVLNYHRVGNRNDCPYDSGVFSATADEFDEQVRFLARKFHIATLEEVIEIVGSTRRPQGTVILLTFDDGYLDNYETVFPILSARKAHGVFFLPTAFIGTDHIPWWDTIAYIIKRSRKSEFELNCGSVEKFDIPREGIQRVIDQALMMYKMASVKDSQRFISMLETACDASRPDGSSRCFMNWDEAAQLLRRGMSIGSHTHEHEVLSPLPEARQFEELSVSKRELQDRLGIPVEALAYPVGLRESFSPVTRAAAAKADYRVAFSFYGGTNRFGLIDRYDVRRYSVAESLPRFRLSTTLAAVTGTASI